MSLSRPDFTTAFRLPKQLLEKIDGICEQLDLSRSQFFRRSVKDFISFHQLDQETVRHQPQKDVGHDSEDLDRFGR